MVIFGHGQGGGVDPTPPPWEITFLGKIFKIPWGGGGGGGSGPPEKLPF